MFASGEESILNSIFRVWSVPQEPKSPLVKHGQVARHSIVEFLCALTKEAGVNCSLIFSERPYRRHNAPPSPSNPGEAGKLATAFFPADPHLPQTGSRQPTDQKKRSGNVC